MQTLVSVIIPTYKGSKELKRAVDSVLTQTYKNVEVIIVDDNIPESEERKVTEYIMNQYADRNNVFYYKHECNKNGSAARNTGISKAKGEYIAFLDDDDYYLSDRIEKSMKYCEDNPKVGGVIVGVQIINEHQKIMDTIVPKEFLSIKKLLQDEMAIGTGSNIFLKKDAILRIKGFDEHFIRRQDIEFMIRICRENQIGYLKDILIVKSVNGTLNHPSYIKMKSVIKQFSEKFEKEINCLEDEVAKYYLTQYRTLFMIALYERERKNIREAKSLMERYGRLNFKERLLYWFYISGLRDTKVIKALIVLKQGGKSQ